MRRNEAEDETKILIYCGFLGGKNAEIHLRWCSQSGVTIAGCRVARVHLSEKVLLILLEESPQARVKGQKATAKLSAAAAAGRDHR